MKTMQKLLALFLLLIMTQGSKAQVLTSNRQNYFNKYSEKLPATTNELEKAFTVSEGSKVKLNFGDFTFNGVVISSIKRYDNLYSVIVKAPDMNNTLLAISKRINDDHTITYVGRIINEKYADGFELRKENNGYAMNKIKTDALIEDY